LGQHTRKELGCRQQEEQLGELALHRRRRRGWEEKKIEKHRKGDFLSFGDKIMLCGSLNGC